MGFLLPGKFAWVCMRFSFAWQAWRSCLRHRTQACSPYHRPPTFCQHIYSHHHFLSGELKISLRCSLREEKRCWCWCRWWRRRPPGCRHCSSSCSWSLPASFAISRVIWTMHDARGRGDDDEGLPDGGDPPCSHSYGSLVAHHCWSSNIQRHLTTCIWVQLCCSILIVLEENGSCCWEGCRKSWLQQIWWMITGEWGETFNGPLIEIDFNLI